MFHLALFTLAVLLFMVAAVLTISFVFSGLYLLAGVSLLHVFAAYLMISAMYTVLTRRV